MLTIKLDPKPGALAQVLGAFREAKVNVTASWAYQMGPGEAQAHFFTGDFDRAKQALIAKAGINIEATDAFAIGGRFATVIFVAESDVPKTAKALGA